MVNPKVYELCGLDKDTCQGFAFGIGGKDYCKKYSKIIELAEYFIVSLYHCLANTEYTKEDEKKLDKIIEEHKLLTKALESYENFTLLMPKIGVTVDLDGSEQHIILFWDKMREKLYEITVKNGMKEGIINYDADTGRMQIKGAKLDNCFEIEGIDIVECEISQGNLLNCDIFNSIIKNSCNTFCNFFDNSKVVSSKIESCYVARGVICDDCYVFGTNGVFSGHMTGPGIFREGRTTKFAEFDKSVEVIEQEKI